MSKRSDGSWFGLALVLSPILAIAGHFIFPNIFFLKLVANVAVLLTGSILLAAWSEILGGATELSLPFATILLVVIVGSILFFRFGWLSTFIILGVYGGMSLWEGISQRSMQSKS